MSERATKQGQNVSAETAKPLLTTREAAAYLGVHERTIRRAIARGDLPARKQDGAYRIDAAALDRFAAPHAVPRLVTLNPPRNGMATLPQPLTPFIGRESDRETVIALLHDPAIRLLTLTGPGGIGKTRLAIEAANAMQAEFLDGVVFVNLAPIAREELTLSAIAQALGLQESGRHDFLQRVQAFLRTRRLLLLLDNFEHLLGAAPLVAQLLLEAPRVKALVTSRASLQIGGEHELPVTTLSLPTVGEPFTAESLLASDAGSLFVSRARDVNAALALDEQSAGAVAEICARLDGVPLAIELAAARAKLLPPHVLLERLGATLPVLTTGSRDAPQRQRTLRDAIAWSYDLLSANEQHLFRRLAVFAGSFMLEAAESVGGELDLFASLLDQSLLVREVGPLGESRFRMLETVREFGLEQLVACGEEAPASAAHARFFGQLAESLRVPALLHVAAEPLERLGAAHANLRAALTWFDETSSDAEFVGMAAALGGYWGALSHFREWQAWLERALVKSDAASELDRARVLIGLGRLAALRGETAEAETYFAAGLPRLRELGDPLETSAALIWRSSLEMANAEGDEAAAERLITEALALVEAGDESRWSVAATGNALANLGRWHRRRGEFALAEQRHEAVLKRFREHGLERGVTRSLLDLGDIARDQGNAPLAAARYQAVLPRAVAEGDLRLVTEVMEGVAGAAAALGDLGPAARLYGAAEALRERVGTSIDHPTDLAFQHRGLATLRQTLGDQRLSALMAEGRALAQASAEAEIAVVVADASPPTARLAERDDSGELTARELEVLRLLVARRTDREIAELLFLSPRTVNWHVASILGKLGAASRREAAAQAVTDGLV